jgi:hypothetical protein
MSGSVDLGFVMSTADGSTRIVVAADVLRGLSGRTHVTSAELLDIYRADLIDAARRKIGGGIAPSVIRIEVGDL